MATSQSQRIYRRRSRSLRASCSSISKPPPSASLRHVTIPIAAAAAIWRFSPTSFYPLVDTPALSAHICTPTFRDKRYTLGGTNITRFRANSEHSMLPVETRSRRVGYCCRATPTPRVQLRCLISLLALHHQQGDSINVCKTHAHGLERCAWGRVRCIRRKCSAPVTLRS